MNYEPTAFDSDSILGEIHATKDQNGKRFDYDIRALAHDLMLRQVLLRDAPSPSLAITGSTAPAKLKRRTARITQSEAQGHGLSFAGLDCPVNSLTPFGSCWILYWSVKKPPGFAGI